MNNSAALKGSKKNMVMGFAFAILLMSTVILTSIY